MTPVHVLHDMAADLGVDVAKDFAALYLSSLEGRVRRLRDALLADDTAEAYTAAVSLYTASWMVGAQDVADAAHDVAEAARSGDPEGARAGLPTVESSIPPAVAAIRLAVSELESAGTPHRARSR